MEFLIILFIVSVVVLLSVIVLIFLGVITYTNEIYHNIESRILDLENQDQGYTSDPFGKPKETMQSSAHIIVPNTPDQIRNKNFQKIKEGQTYGNLD